MPGQLSIYVMTRDDNERRLVSYIFMLSSNFIDKCFIETDIGSKPSAT